MSVCPRKIEVAKVLESREFSQAPERFVTTESFYAASTRPSRWDERVEGVDIIETAEGELVTLYSDGMQSVPKPGWTILTTGGDKQNGYTWTLYGISPHH
jgi:hypothetical protein